MRILRITVNNIASLSGTHTVDFTRDPLRSAGLYSISGATGAGKSTLLDALCLALYDATPRLNQVGRLAELANGEKQSDPRNLLRRGAGEGFAEVAFVGVDGQSWTSRWRVRRSRRSAEGSLQSVEMTLYHGHIPAGGEGTVAEGGKKTQVLKSIEGKIGLTFEQFTRAVLLAQNDFATFLKADDKERAEILQALTGTAHFESISRSVFLRCGIEQKALESLGSLLAGNAPLTEEARAEAEAARSAAEQQLATVEARHKELQSHADWFSTRAKLIAEKSRADETLQQAMDHRTAAASRRCELARTEELARDARPLRVAERTALAQATATAAAAELAKTKHGELELAFKAAADRHQAAVEIHTTLLAEQKANELSLRKARALDETLSIVQTQFQKSSADLEVANAALKTAEENLRTVVDGRNLRLQEQLSLEQDRERLKAFAPFVADSAKWLDRIDAAIAIAQQVDVAKAHAESLAGELAELDGRLKLEEESRTPLQTAFESATAALAAAIEAEKKYDTDQLAADRTKRESAKSVLTALFHQLKNAQGLRERVKTEAEALEQLQAAQGFDATAIEQIRTVEIPKSELAIEVAKTQLEFIQAAVDDHAKRLRLTLQEGKECPVCGSTSHPYSQHAPELEATAVKAARKSVKDLEKKRDDALSREARLRGSMETRNEQIDTKTAELAATRAEVVEIVFESHDHPEVSAVLAIEEGARLPVMEARLLDINLELRAIDKKEQNARNAAKTTSECREALLNSERALKELNDRLQQLSTSRGILNETHNNAAAGLRKAEEQRAEVDGRLSDLWFGLPTAKHDFDLDAVAFRRAFEGSATECGDIEKRIGELTGQIQQADAAIRPLEQSVTDARTLANGCAAAFAEISKGREERLKERSQLFDGRAADLVEEEQANRVAAAAKSLDDAAGAKTDADRLLVAATSEWETKIQAAELAQAELAATTAVRERWIEAFTVRTETSLTLQELDGVLARDEAWIQTERDALRQLDEAVTAAESACQVYAEQLQQHVNTQPTQDEEETVLAALIVMTEELGGAKRILSSAQAVILSDDSRRVQNVDLMEQIRRQDAKTDPWRKLNELLGSSDGAKFRMIAQRRTLDLLLRYANHQLHNLAGRYRLERLPESLNLIVIDRDMGDETRSIHSLSGGESFLVSLALALGLASLTSNRLRIESLFIDEGFGSLDPETLNTAMSALMHLEAQGRKVGVISHVTEMTDAIPVQIKVVKGRGGASRILVPGDHAAAESEIPVAVPESSKEAAREDSAELLGNRIVALLQREMQAGKDRVSTKSLREELGCEQKAFKAAQAWLGGRVIVDGRSLKLNVVTDAG
jgi:exonuclease SbcC